jgi:hypothetical protein
MEWPGPFESVEEIDIETSRGGDAPVHRTTIWPVVDQGAVYVRSLKGGAGRWYQEALANPDVVLHLDGKSIPARAFHTPDRESIQHATAGFQRKYADSPYVDTMIRDEILDTTVRLEPR